MTEFVQRLENKIHSRKLLPRREKILVAVSGGADSMVLLHALNTLAKKFRWKIFVAHFNHQLRGRSSDADEKLVRKTAAALKLLFVLETADVKKIAHESKLSIEMAARKLRHAFFARAARKLKIKTVALAHHADDQVELFFLRVLRGAGGEGLAGMKWRAPSPADSKITLVRPLLDFSKSEILTFARASKIKFRADATNFSNDFLRNRIRNELLPLLRKKYQPGLDKTVLRLMEIVGAESEFIGHSSERQFAQNKKKNLADLPLAVQRRVLQSQLAKAKIASDFDLIESLRQSPDQFISVSSKISVACDAFGKIELRNEAKLEFNANELAIKFAGRAGEFVFDGVSFRWSFASGSRGRSPHQLQREFFDADKVGGKIILRHWRPGDFFQPIGLKSAAKLQDLFTNAKIPRARRHKLIVAVAEHGEIFWVEGLRISENFKLTPETKIRLVWRWRRSQSV